MFARNLASIAVSFGFFGADCRVFSFFVAVPNHMQRPRAEAARAAPVHQGVVGAMGDPDLRRAGGGNHGGQAIPVRVVGDHQRQLDAALAGARPYPHPSGRKGRDWLRKAARPAVVQR